MDIMALLPAFLVVLGIVWAIWLIFKRDLLSQNIVKLLMYFLGVVITFIIVGWLVDTFLPQWTLQRLITARNSGEVRQIGDIGREIWQDAVGRPGTAPTVVITTPAPVPAPGTSPAPTPAPEESSSAAGQAVGLRPGEQVYTVVRGDTLFSLSRRFGVSIAAIQQRNGLGASTTIRVGQQLIIPAP